jgi:hypothetical protein
MQKAKILTLLILLYSSILLADAANFYVGLDFLKTNYSTQEGYGKNVFGKNPTALNAFVGYNLPKNLFLEVGYEWNRSKNNTVKLEEGEQVLPGVLNDIELPGAYDITRTVIKKKLPYFGIGAKYILSDFSKTSISILAGVSIVNVKSYFEIIGNDLINTFPQSAIDDSRKIFNKRKISPLLKLLVQQQLSNNFELRLTNTWYKLNNFKIRGVDNTGEETIAEIRLKNGYSFGVGIVYNM